MARSSGPADTGLSIAPPSSGARCPGSSDRCAGWGAPRERDDALIQWLHRWRGAACGANSKAALV